MTIVCLVCQNPWGVGNLKLSSSGKKKQHKDKLFGPDFPRTFLTLTPECPGVKKFLPTTRAAGKRTFWCGCPRFSARTSMTRRVVEKLCTEKVCVDFLAPTSGIKVTYIGLSAWLQEPRGATHAVHSFSGKTVRTEYIHVTCFDLNC